MTVRQIGDQLMTKYILPLEVLGLLLTAALIGAVIIAMREKGSVQIGHRAQGDPTNRNGEANHSHRIETTELHSVAAGQTPEVSS